MIEHAPVPESQMRNDQPHVFSDQLTRAMIILQIGIIVLAGLYLTGTRMMSVAMQILGTSF